MFYNRSPSLSYRVLIYTLRVAECRASFVLEFLWLAQVAVAQKEVPFMYQKMQYLSGGRGTRGILIRSSPNQALSYGDLDSGRGRKWGCTIVP